MKKNDMDRLWLVECRSGTALRLYYAVRAVDEASARQRVMARPEVPCGEPIPE